MVKKTVLNNGLTVISEAIHGIPSFALSYTLKAGSGVECASENGIHHLIEHMLFKGSERYSLQDIAVLSDKMGGHLNALTSKEITQFYLKAIDDQFPASFDLLTNMVFNSKFGSSEFRREVDVICQEIRESDDDPDSLIFDLFYKNIFGRQGIGLPVAGTVDSVRNLSRNDVFTYYRENYVPSNMILSCAGNIDHELLLETVNNYFSQEEKRPAGVIAPLKPDLFRNSVRVKQNDDLKQIYVLIGLEGIAVPDKDRYLFLMFNEILGAGMSSRLFQKIREEEGLAYSVSSFPDSYHDYGILLIYSSLDPVNLHQYLSIVRMELERIKKDGVTLDEIENSKNHLKASVILSLENNVAKMRFNINNELYFGRNRSYRDILSRIDSADKIRMNDFLNTRIHTDNLAVMIYGNVDNPDLKI